MAKRKKRKPTTRPVDVDVVIPVYGRFDLVKNCLDAIPAAAGDVSYRIIVVDDYSPDQVAADAFYATLPMSLRVVRRQRNGGYPAAVNSGAAIGSAAAILVLNSDVELSPGAIARLYETLMNDDSVPLSPIDPANSDGIGIVAPLLTFPPDSAGGEKVQHAGLFFDLWANPVHRYIGWSPDNDRVMKPTGVQAVSGACMMIKRPVWNIIYERQRAAGDKSGGALNEVYGRGTFEDIELCVAARVNGYRVVYEPRARGTHVVGASVAETPEGGYPLTRNRSVFLARAGHLILYDEWIVA